MPVLTFLASVLVLFSDFKFLHTLHIDDGGVDADPEYRRYATILMDVLVRDYIWALSSLNLVCHINDFGPDALYAQSSTLRHLAIRDHQSIMADAYAPYPTIDPLELKELSERMAMLETIELDMDGRDRPRASEFLEALIEFPRLSKLTLHIRTAAKMAPLHNLPSSRRLSPDVMYVRTVLEFLVQSAPRPPFTPSTVATMATA